MPINRKSIEHFKGLELLAKKAVEGFITGMHKSPFHGFSVEFAEHRLYNTGESRRHIDWKLLARTEKLFIKRYEEETNLRCQIVIDRSSSMLFPKESAENKLKFSIYAAAALCELLKQQRDACGLTVFDSEIRNHFPAKGSPTHHKLIFTELEKLLEEEHLNHSTAAAAAINQIAEVIHSRSLVMIFSDMFDNVAATNDLFSSLQHLKYKKHEVVLFHVTDKKFENNLDFENKPYHFIDMETGEEIKLNPSMVKTQYMTQMEKFNEDLRIKCGQYNIDLVESDIHDGFDKVLFTYLVKRSRMLR